MRGPRTRCVPADPSLPRVTEGGSSVVDHTPNLLVGEASLFPRGHRGAWKAVGNPVVKLAVRVHTWRRMNTQVRRARHQAQTSRAIAVARLAVAHLAIRRIDVLAN